MPTKATGRGTVDEVDRWPGGVEWIAHPHETMERSSHALVTDEGVWVVDPVDAVGLDDVLDSLGEVVGVVVMLEQHSRDAVRIASRHDVPVAMPSWLRVSLDVPVERFTDRLGGTRYELVPILVTHLWREGALYDGDTLYVPESVGTASYFRAPGEALGVSHMRRPWPPREALGSLEPDHLIVGHGPGIHTGATATLHAAIENARPSALTYYRTTFPTYFRTLWAAMRT